MIIKSLRHKAPSAEYSVNYVFNGMPPKKENQWVIFQNITKGYDRNSIIQEFNDTAKLLRISPNRKTTIRYHEVLGFSHKSSPHITREKLQAIAHEYLKLRDPESASNALCVPHCEKGGHWHIHTLLSSNDVGSPKSGDRMMGDYFYYELRRETERFMLKTYPELHHSTVYLSEKEIQSLIPEQYRAERRLMELEKQPKKKGSAIKEQASGIVKSILDKSNTLNEFIEKINTNSDYKTYSRRGKLTGIIQKEGKKKFRFSTLGINLLDENFIVLSRMNELEALNKENSSKSLER